MKKFVIREKGVKERMLIKNEFHPILKEFRLEFKHEKAHAQFMPYSKMTPANHIVRHFSSLLLQAVGRKKKKLNSNSNVNLL